MLPPRPTSVLLVALLALLVHAGAQDDATVDYRRGLQAVTKTRPRQRFCNNLPRHSTASADQLLRQRTNGSKCSDFLKGVRDWKLQNLLRRVSRGKVILCPTNDAMMKRFIKVGLYKRPFEIPAKAKAAFRTYIMTQVAVPRSKIPLKVGCGDLYSQYKPNSMAWWDLQVIKKGQGELRTAEGEEVIEYEFSVLGHGYNSFIGFPLSFGMTSNDPGFTYGPVFELVRKNVGTVTGGGGACESQFSTSSYNSANNMKESITASLGINGNFGAVAMQGSAQFKMASETSAKSQTITTNSGAKVYLGTYALRGGPGGLSLDPGFVATLLPLMQAASEDRWDTGALNALVNHYGTHYVFTVTYGGVAAVMNQMTSQGFSSLKELGVSVSIAVQASMVQVNADVDYSKTNSDEVTQSSSSFTQILIPSSVPLALTSSKVVDDASSGEPPSPSFIDCVQWTTALREASLATTNSWKAPVVYQIAPLDNIFAFPALFPSDWASVLPAMRAQLITYMTRCGFTAKNQLKWQKDITLDPERYTACVEPEIFNQCVVGTYEAPGGCNTCYGDGDVIGPNCNTTVTISCTKYDCFCFPKYANNPEVRANNRCTPLAPNPKAPPAPSMIDLINAGKKK